MAFPPPPDWNQYLSENAGKIFELLASGEIDALPDGRYLHWDKLKHRKAPNGLTHEIWWAGVKAARVSQRKHIPLRDQGGRPFHFCPVEPIQEHLHQIDSRLTGRIALPDTIMTSAQRDRYLVSSLIEEAITSSQLEGAATTRKVAADMLRSGRKPRNHDERMIFNNYRAMALIRTWDEQAFSPERVLELHRRVSEGTLEDPESSGKLQAPGEERVEVRDNLTGDTLHRPPPAEELPERLRQLCRFANTRMTGGDFLHPVLHAIILHFWLAWDHPFSDGNGRTARALFYWKMLKADYWPFQFISISTILRQAPGKYKRALLRTETDDNDLTYFLIHQLEVISEATDQLERYLRRKTDEIQAVERLLRTTSPLNHRQLALLSNALRKTDSTYSIASHRNSHQVAYATARADLLELAELGYLIQSPAGTKPIRFAVPADLEQRVREKENSDES